MPARQRSGDLGAIEARRGIDAMLREIHHERVQLGLSLRDVARRAGMSSAQVGRLELGRLRHPTVDQLGRAARAVGLRLSLKTYPAEEGVRDAPQLRIFLRLEAILAATLRLDREVGLPIPADRRAWDGRIRDGHGTASIEVVARLDDVQETQRRIELKRRDDPDAGVVILVLGRTAHNRRVLGAHREALRAQFPLDGAPILRDLRHGRVPAAGGIVLI